MRCVLCDDALEVGEAVAHFDGSAHERCVIARAEELIAAGSSCEWFVRCTRAATRVEPHPILGVVPVCEVHPAPAPG